MLSFFVFFLASGTVDSASGEDISTHWDDVSPLTLKLLPVVMTFLFVSLQLDSFPQRGNVNSCREQQEQGR